MEKFIDQQDQPSSSSSADSFTAALARYDKMRGNAPERLVSGSDDFTMFLWEPDVRKHPKTRMTGHQQLVNHVYFSPDGQWIASASFDKSVKLWNGVTGKFVAVFRGHVGPVYQISWSVDSRLLLSGSKDSMLILIIVEKLKQHGAIPELHDSTQAIFTTSLPKSSSKLMKTTANVAADRLPKPGTRFVFSRAAPPKFNSLASEWLATTSFEIQFKTCLVGAGLDGKYTTLEARIKFFYHLGGIVVYGQAPPCQGGSNVFKSRQSRIY